MAERTINGRPRDGGGNADAVERGVSNVTWKVILVLALFILLGALALGGFLGLSSEGVKINSENTPSRPAEP